MGDRFHYWGFVEDGAFIAPSTSPGCSIEEAEKRSQMLIGCHDKSGKEMFEGDIVKRYFQSHVKDCKPIISVIEWRNAEFYLDHPMLMSSWPYDLLKVIGNIYENPELN